MTATAPGRVLVVDDSANVRETLRTLLEGEGCRVTTAANGEEALARLAEARPALVLTAVQMPVMTGWELHDALRARRSHIPVVVMSLRPDLRAEAAAHHVDGWLAQAVRRR